MIFLNSRRNIAKYKKSVRDLKSLVANRIKIINLNHFILNGIWFKSLEIWPNTVYRNANGFTRIVGNMVALRLMSEANWKSFISEA